MIFNKNRNKAASSVSKTDLLGTSALTTQRSVMRTAWDLIKPYWATGTSNKEKMIAYTLLATALGMTIWSSVGISVSIADWSSQWGDTLQNMFALATNHKDWVTDKTLASSTDMQAQLKDFWVNLGNYGILASKNLFAAAAGFVSLQELALRWRGWETDRQVNNWLDDDAYYRTQIAKKMVDNPDQRLAEDIPELTNTTINLINDAVGNTLTFWIFSRMLWGMSGDFNLASMGSAMPDLIIPRFMFTAAIAYAAAGTGITYLLGRKLADQQFQQQKLEANFRADLIRTLENSEQVAMGKAAGVQKDTIIDDFDLVQKNRKNLIRTQKTLLISNSVYGQAADPFPVLITLPLILAGKVTYGGFRKTAFAFGRVQGALSWFVDNFQTLARYKATINRLGNYNDAVQQVKDEHESRKALADEEAARRAGKPRPIQVSENDGGDITFKNITLVRPGTDTVLLKDFSYTLKAGETMVLTGASGCGKSTLFRAAEDFCEEGSGDITLPKDRMGSAQKIFMPKVPVRDMITYNVLGKKFTDAEIEFSLNEAGLERLVQHIPGRHTQNAIDAVLAALPANIDSTALNNDLADRIIAGISGKYETAQSTPESVTTYLAEQLARKFPGQDAEMKTIANAAIVRVDQYLVDGLIDILKGGVERTLADAIGKKFLLPSEVAPFSAALMKNFSRKMDETFDPKNLKSREIKAPTVAQRNYMTEKIGVHVTQMLGRYIVCGEMHRAKFERTLLNPKIHLSLGAAFTYAASPVKRLTNFTASSTAASGLINKLAVTLRQQVVNGYTLSKELSGGEQQRIAFARAYLQKPKFLMMDEPSSALDPAAGIDLFGKLNKHLPNTARIVIAHNEYVVGTADYHAEMSEQHITVKPVAANGNKPGGPELGLTG